MVIYMYIKDSKILRSSKNLDLLKSVNELFPFINVHFYIFGEKERKCPILTL